MSYAKAPAVLDIMLLTAAVDNRKLIEDLFDKVRTIKSEIGKIESRLEEIM